MTGRKFLYSLHIHIQQNFKPTILLFYNFKIYTIQNIDLNNLNFTEILIRKYCMTILNGIFCCPFRRKFNHNIEYWFYCNEIDIIHITNILY